MCVCEREIERDRKRKREGTSEGGRERRSHNSKEVIYSKRVIFGNLVLQKKSIRRNFGILGTRESQRFDLGQERTGSPRYLRFCYFRF